MSRGEIARDWWRGAGPCRPADRVETRHDAALDRTRWHFAPRQVAVRTVDIRPEEER